MKLNLKNKILSKITFGIFPRYKLEDVFTPAIAANINYVKREDIDKMLCCDMSTPGKQIIVFGHSGSGKTSSVRKMLKHNGYNFINTQCESSTTFEQLVLNAFDALNIFVVNKKTKKKSASLKGELAKEYLQIKGLLNGEIYTESSSTYERILPPQLTPQKLAQFMGKGNIVWMIEDFHKVAQEEKIKIADVIKIFVDNANDYKHSKIICIGACQSAYELINLSTKPNLQYRVSEIHVPLLSDEEIRQIITNGFSLLNVSPEESLVDKLVFYSDKIGCVAHQMCMDICKKERIYRRCIHKKEIKDSSFQYAVDGFIKQSADTFKSIYEAATKNDLGWYILKTFSSNSNKISFDEINNKVNKGKKSFTKDEIRETLKKLMKSDFGIIYYNEKIDKYALSTPFWHRFLRLQFSIEKAEQEKKKNNKKNPNLNLIDKNNKYEVVDQLMLDLIEKIQRNLI